MVHPETIDNRPDVIPGPGRDKMVVKGEGNHPEAVTFFEELEGVARVLSSAIGHNGIVSPSPAFSMRHKIIQFLAVLSSLSGALCQGHFFLMAMVTDALIIESDIWESFWEYASVANSQLSLQSLSSLWPLCSCYEVTPLFGSHIS